VLPEYVPPGDRDNLLAEKIPEWINILEGVLIETQEQTERNQKSHVRPCGQVPEIDSRDQGVSF
jgi:hypothetical protein